MLNSATGPVLPMPMAPPMIVILIMASTSGYSSTSSAAFVSAPVHTRSTGRPLRISPHKRGYYTGREFWPGAEGGSMQRLRPLLSR